MFFQPQIDIRTGKLVGAEALVRGVDEDGKIILPGKFIEAMEKNGSIRDLDLFVLDQTLAQMDRWREQGMELVPVSVNFLPHHAVRFHDRGVHPGDPEPLSRAAGRPA